jgi:hypothetical protein
MKIRTSLLFTTLGLALALPVAGLSAAEASSGKKSLNLPGRMVVKTLAATITAINQDTREVTIKGKQGNEFTLVADPQIARLNEFRVGDEIVLDYSVSLAADVRQPTPEELAKPYSVIEDTTKAKSDQTPGVEGYKIIEAVVTVEGLDRQTQTLTVKGPKGNYVAINVKDPATLEKLRLGDVALVVYSESFALRLEKAPAKP